MALAIAAQWAGTAAATAFGGAAPDPAEVRQAALEAGLGSLATVPVPKPDNLDDFLNPGSLPRFAAKALGKALFWDMQVGSDGQACASCHFHAFADSRAKNQLNPGTRNVDPARQHAFARTGSGAAGGPNYELVEADFPFHLLADPEEENFLRRIVLFDSNDVASSQGVFSARFHHIVPGEPDDVGLPLADQVFQVNGKNVRRVEPRNTPTIVNAVFNFTNFWDGRAHNAFNGESVFGPLDEEARIYVAAFGYFLLPKTVRIPNSSLASQAVGPPLNDMEMSFFDRPFPEVARKLLSLRPLGLQLVHPLDSLLGLLSRATLYQNQLIGQPGLWTTYKLLIQIAFRPKYWISPLEIGGCSQMELNFPLFFGLAVQMYESTLVSDQTPFDEFMEGDDGALDEEQLRGLLTFIRTPASNDPVFTPDIGIGNCVSCHSGPEFTAAAFTSLAGPKGPGLIGVQSMPQLEDGLLVAGDQTAFVDSGFANIGVREASEDLGRGGTELGLPLSFVRQNLAGFPGAPPLPPCAPNCPNGRVSVDGAFKVPGLRNVELTGPYFHNGGQATLEQTVEFYDRQSDFGDLNVANLDLNIALIDISDVDEDPLVQFLLSLTDDRVREERAPFDHPQLFVPNGHRGNHLFLECINGNQACDDVMAIPGLGNGGRPAAGLPPLEPFLGLDPGS